MKGEAWTPAEAAVVRDHPELSPKKLHEALLPHRSVAAIANERHRQREGSGLKRIVRKPGDYLEILADLLVDELDAMEIWLRHNGYSSFREISRDRAGWCTLVCTAKGE